MAQKVKVTVVCDLPHDGEVEGEETVSFSFDGTAYEIDVCAKHAKELQRQGQPVRRPRAQGEWGRPPAPDPRRSGSRAQRRNQVVGEAARLQGQ